MRCTSCQTENRTGRRFCAECGAPLNLACPACGAENEPGERFCGECGAPLADESAAPAAAPRAELDERRLVSVLFVDLVGFTTLSESRDPEAVRELLSRYFDRARSLITRYGGTIEKFIGDAIVAVWGAPVAREDDAERAVRAALELTTSVAALGAEAGASELRARAGIVTGEASVKVGVAGEGMVVGDTINTASRVQSAAEPGTVLVDRTTERSAHAAVAFESAGEHELKGKAAPVALFRALRVTAGVPESESEAPLAGRATERQALIDAVDACFTDSSPRLALIVGEAGMGKTRLRLELEHYLEGLTETVFWHRGRSLAYGDGVAFWALAEMIRTRCGIAEDEKEAESAREKLAATVERFVADPGDRRMVEPRLATLLGLERGRTRERADLFSGWRLFFEALSDQAPVALVFEDLHLADPGLLEFIDYLLEWSASRPISIVGLARPSLAEIRPAWREERPDVSWIELAPLSDTAMDELLSALAPGAPQPVLDRIRDRAEGVPLYAVEMVRMLIDRGALERRGDRFELVRAVEDVDVPETLHALIAARLDGLDPEERRLLMDAAVLGQSFTLEGLTWVSGGAGPEVTGTLESLVAKRMVVLDEDPYSAERGQYRFTQALIQRVAYSVLSRHDRKERHLRAARYLERAWGKEATEIADVLAAHYIDAVEAEPEATDAAAITANARETLVEAGTRALALAAGEQAASYFHRASELAVDPIERAGLLESAGEANALAGRGEQALGRYSEATAIFGSLGEAKRAAGVGLRAAEILYLQGRNSQALEQLLPAYDLLAGGEPNSATAAAAALRARICLAMGRGDEAAEQAELAAVQAQRLHDPEAIASALITKGTVLSQSGRVHEGIGLMDHGLDLALEHDLLPLALRTYNNLAQAMGNQGSPEEALELAQRGVELARRCGDRRWEWWLTSGSLINLFYLGRWNEALEAAAGLPGAEADAAIGLVEAARIRVMIRIARGEREAAEPEVRHIASYAGKGDVRVDADAAVAKAQLARQRGDAAGALRESETVLPEVDTNLVHDLSGQQILIEGLESALAVDALDKARAILDRTRGLVVELGLPYLAAEADRLGARLAARRDEVEEAGQTYRRAEAEFRQLGYPFHLAVTLLEHAEDLPDDDAAKRRSEALEIFERLEAAPWIERARRRDESGRVLQPG